MDSVLDLADLAAEQWGLVTAAQARAVGVSNQMAARLADQGRLERLAYGVYRVTGAPADQLDGLRAAWLALDPARTAAERRQDPTPAVVSHRAAAAAVYKYGDLDGDVYEFTTPGRRQSRRSDVRFHRATLEPGEWTVVDGLPVTTPVRTIIDLAATRIDGGHLAAVVRDAVTRYDVDEAELAERLRPYADKYGAPLGDGARMIQAFLEQAGVPASLLATSAALRAAIRAAGPIETSAFAAANAPAMQSISESLSRLLAQANAPALEAARRVAAQATLPAIKASQRLTEANAPTVATARRLRAKVPRIAVPKTPGLAALTRGVDDEHDEDDQDDNRDDLENGGE